jgi:hypothetical protein
MAEIISYLVSAPCIGGMSWVVVGTIVAARRRRMNRHLEEGLAKYLLGKATLNSN